MSTSLSSVGPEDQSKKPMFIVASILMGVYALNLVLLNIKALTLPSDSRYLEEVFKVSFEDYFFGTEIAGLQTIGETSDIASVE